LGPSLQSGSPSGEGRKEAERPSRCACPTMQDPGFARFKNALVGRARRCGCCETTTSRVTGTRSRTLQPLSAHDLSTTPTAFPQHWVSVSHRVRVADPPFGGKRLGADSRRKFHLWDLCRIVRAHLREHAFQAPAILRDEVRGFALLDASAGEGRRRSAALASKATRPQGIFTPSGRHIRDARRPRQRQTRREAGAQSHGPLKGEAAGPPKEHPQ
jgi:hypothetical protein